VATPSALDVVAASNTWRNAYAGYIGRCRCYRCSTRGLHRAWLQVVVALAATRKHIGGKGKVPSQRHIVEEREKEMVLICHFISSPYGLF